jgi:hypothetical protein
VAKDYEVGRGRPPKHSQFKDGQSGNPRGRPKGRPNRKTLIQRMLDEKVTVKTAGGTKRISAAEAATRRVFELAMKGDWKALELFLRWVEACNADNDNATEPSSAEEDEILAAFTRQVMEREKRRKGSGGE